MIQKITAWKKQILANWRDDKEQRKKEKEIFKQNYREERIKAVKRKAKYEAKRDVFEKREFASTGAERAIKSMGSTLWKNLKSNAESSRKEGFVAPMFKLPMDKNQK